MEISYIWIVSWLYRCKLLLKPIDLYTLNVFDCKVYLDKVFFFKLLSLIAGQCVMICPPDG